jgi:hypothetical protein
LCQDAPVIIVKLPLPLSGRQRDRGGAAKSYRLPVHSRGLLGPLFTISKITLYILPKGIPTNLANGSKIFRVVNLLMAILKLIQLDFICLLRPPLQNGHKIFPLEISKKKASGSD